MTITEARELVYRHYFTGLQNEMRADLFADHVDTNAKTEYYNRRLVEINRIRTGECDHCLYVQQRIHYYMTGEMVALLPI